MPVSVSSLSRLDASPVSSLLRLRQLGLAISKNTERVVTLQRINSAADDPAGLVSGLRLHSQLKTLEVTARGLSRADSILTTAADVSSRIVDQLIEARRLSLEAASGILTSAEVAANQAELDQVLRTVDTLAGTEFNGRRLLDGTASFRTTGVDTTKIDDVEILDKQTGADVPVSIHVLTQAAQAHNSYAGGTLSIDTTLEVRGPDGTATIALARGATTDAIAQAVSDTSAQTGIVATRVDATRIEFKTAEYGTAAKLEISATQGNFQLTTEGTVAGTDAIALINGRTTTGEGSTFTVATDQAVMRIAVNPATIGVVSPFSVSGEGMIITLDVDTASVTHFGLPKLTTSAFHGPAGSLSSVAGGGANSLTSGNAATAYRIIGQALDRAMRAQSSLEGERQYTLGSVGNVLSSTSEHLAEALNRIVGTDFAVELSLLATNRILQNATQQSFQIFSLQRRSVFNLLSVAAKRD